MLVNFENYYNWKYLKFRLCYQQWRPKDNPHASNPTGRVKRKCSIWKVNIHTSTQQYLTISEYNVTFFCPDNKFVCQNLFRVQKSFNLTMGLQVWPGGENRAWIAAVPKQGNFPRCQFRRENTAKGEICLQLAKLASWRIEGINVADKHLYQANISSPCLDMWNK